jgi:hypothetical protein
MEKSIRYKRFFETHNEETLQEFFDKLVTEGWEIIYYSEHQMMEGKFQITVVCGKKQDNELKHVL